MQWSSFFRSCIEVMQPYQPGMREEQIRQIAKSAEIYKLSSNESPLQPFPSAILAMRDSLALLNEYPDGSGYDLKQALASYYSILPDEIILGNGTNEILTLIAETCLNPGDNVVYSWPSFVVYRYSAQLMGATCREVALNDKGGFDLQAMLAQIDDKTKIVYICSPNNPTGVCVTKQQLSDFLKRLPDHVLVVLDCAYEEFVDRSLAADPDNNASLNEYPAYPFSFYDGKRPLVVLKTFSKAYALAGIRVGYGFAPKPLVQAIDQVREPFNVNTCAQAGAIASLYDTDELKRRVALNSRCRQRLQEGFAALGLKYYPSEANYVWVEIPDPQATFDQLLQRGIIVRPVPGARALRVGVGDDAGVAATLTAFTELFS